MIPMTFWEQAAMWATRNAENGIPTEELAGRALLEVEARLRREIAQLQQAMLELEKRVARLEVK